MGKRLKVISAFWIVVNLFAIILALPVYAENIYASIESAGVSVEIPNEFNVTAADIDVDENVVYQLDAYMNDTSKKLSITSEKNNVTENTYNFKYLTKEQLEAEIENIKSGNATLMGKVFKSVSNANLKEMPEYILFTLSDSKIQNNITVHYAIAYTLINGELVTIQYSSSSGNFNSEDTQLFSKICESVYVTSLYDKPEKVNVPNMMRTVTTTIVIIGIIIAVILIAYYLISKNNAKSKEVLRNRRKLSEKYYQSLRNEGIMEDIKVEAEEFINENIANSGTTIIEPSENARPKNPETISAIIEEASTNPTLIDDEWEDIDLTTMFQQPEAISVDNYSTDFPAETILGHKEERVIPENIHRADSAKRYAKLFIGDDRNNHNSRSDVYTEIQNDSKNEYFSETSATERQHQERKRQNNRGNTGKKHTRKKRKNTFSLFGLFSKKPKTKKHTTHRKESVSAKSRKTQKNQSSRQRTKSNDTFADYELDNYWNTYQND